MTRPVKLWLDWSGLAPVPDGCQVVETEVEFLRTALGGGPMLVRGRSLCLWADRFWRARGWEYKELDSPVDGLRSLCPDLSDAQAKSLLSAIGDRWPAPEGPESVLETLRLILPEGPWVDAASPGHAARYLLWLREAAIPDFAQPLLKTQGDIWGAGSEFPEKRLYGIVNPDESTRVLAAWLGIDDSERVDGLGVFPEEIPGDLCGQIGARWRRSVVERGCEVLTEISKRALPARAKEIAAGEVCTYCQHHPEALSEGLLRDLADLVPADRIHVLRNLLPPPEPSPLPEEHEQVLKWFAEEYLPYREWQARRDDDAAEQVVADAARAFAGWLLEFYPVALGGGVGHQALAMRRSASLMGVDDGSVTLWVVLDGLHCPDADALMRHIRNSRPAWNEETNAPAFAALPTITRFGKSSLITGLPPAAAEGADAAPGQDFVVLPENRSPSDELKRAAAGKKYIWSHTEPDKTYHKLSDPDVIGDNASGCIRTLADKIVAAVDAIRDELTVRVVVTTDHGRMLAGSLRQLEVPPGMVAEGRAAYGECDITFDETGVMIDEGAGVAFIHAGRFGLPVHSAVALNDGAFVASDGKRGRVEFAHGGLFPEEVIVPWIELVRRQALPEVECTARGKARPSFEGTITLKFANQHSQPVTVHEFRLEIRPEDIRAVPLQGRLAAYSAIELEARLPQWPSYEQLAGAAARVVCRLESGFEFTVPVTLRLEAEQMYKRHNMLEDL